MTNDTAQGYDYVVVGGGSAGAVLAHRLTENAAISVALIEAGDQFAGDDAPKVFTDLSRVGGNETTNWGYHARGTDTAPHIEIPRGKGLGGSSSVNAAVALRARPADIAAWQSHGVTGWAWEDVLATYKSLETFTGGDPAYHGDAGPVHIEQRPLDTLTSSLAAFIRASEAIGYATVDDPNGADQEGVSSYPLTKQGETRWSSALAYLPSTIQQRPNLTVLRGVLIDRVIFDGDHAAGVLTSDGETITATREVILSAGTYGSATVLLRSGIGPREDLTALDIPVLVDAPVGQRVQDQPFYYVTYALQPDALAMEPATGALVWTGSSSARGDELDLHISATHLADPASSPTGGAIVLAAAVTTPESTGTIRLASTDPQDAPVIDLNLLATDRDRERMLEAVRLTRDIASSQAMQAVLDHELTPGSAVQSEEDLIDAIQAGITTYAHPTSSIPMGSGPGSVVDEHGLVRGVTGLRVVDASILPAVPSTTTNLTVFMVAETLAAHVLTTASETSGFTMPAPIAELFAATNRADTEAFVATFTEDARITDFGRTFHGRDGARSWDRTDNIGVGMHFDITSVTETAPGNWKVGMIGTSRRFNGPGALVFTLRDDLIASLDTE